MGIFDNLFKRKEKEDEIVAKLVNMPMENENKKPFRTRGANYLEGVSEIKIQNKRDDLITNLIVEIPLEYRPFNKERSEYYRSVYSSILPKSKVKDYSLELFENKIKDYQFLIIYDITKEEQIKFNSMLDGFKNKVGKEWLSGFIDFMKEVNKTKLNNLTIEDKYFIFDLKTYLKTMSF